MIEYTDAAELVNKQRGDAVVINTMTQTRFWNAISEHPELDIPVSNGMGKASSLGLGIALGAPERRVIVQDGDGSLLMNLGSLVTIANKAPKNFYHFVYDNGVYAVTGGQPVPGGGRVDYVGMARAAGYRAAAFFDDTEELATDLPRLMSEDGPVLIHLKVKPVIQNEGVAQTWESNERMPRQMRSVKAVLAGQSRA